MAAQPVGAPRHQDAVKTQRWRTLTAEERTLCLLHDAIFAAQRRQELCAHYDFAVALYKHRASPDVHLSESLEHCAREIGRVRTTLLRYCNVAMRIKRDEFDALATLSDARGYPLVFWDLVATSRLSREKRYSALTAHLGTRSPPQRSSP